jgi:hypothetical protein
MSISTGVTICCIDFNLVLFFWLLCAGASRYTRENEDLYEAELEEEARWLEDYQKRRKAR